MQRFLVPLIAGFAVVALILSGIVGGARPFQPARVAAQASTPTATATREPGHMLPAQLQFLNSMTPEQRFDHFTGGQMSWVNPQGQAVVLDIVPGMVTAVTTNTVTIQPNGTTTTRTFNVTPNTVIRGGQKSGSLTVFSHGDRVIVTTIGNTNDAASITAFSFTSTGEYGHMPGHGMPGHGMMPTPTGSPTAANPTATPTP